MITIPEENVKRYFRFIKERHAIYIRRQRGDEWPWTEDSILQTYKFTNIFRELDVGTVHCREAIREPYANHPELFFNIATYRLYNYTETQKEIGYIVRYNPDDAMALMYARRKRGGRIFTSAHMITGNVGGGTGVDKIQQVFGLCFTQLWNNRQQLEPQPGDTLEIAFNRLYGHNLGYGAFIAYEAITDLRHTRYLENATDIMTWANAGPGAMRGINRLLGNPVRETSAADRKAYPRREEYVDYMRYLLSVSRDYLPKWVPIMEMRDIEHATCEWDKYERVRLGEGRPRSRYVPPHLRQQV